ncbi:MAG: hypothetical protein ACRDDH_14755 [Cetobacterium sp.]|uniref:hypothetical protein n=1 Tax=Cetobacterium sp. TaxID=2071632 RepID=UPI003EE69E0E
MKKTNYFFMTLILLLSSISISFSSDGREIIKAYENGKPAKLDIEVTKVRSDNNIDLFIDRSEKKIYRDITKSTRENSDLDRKLYVTTYLKPSNKTNTINDELTHKIVTIDGKRYLEISYFEEPKNIYLWVVKNSKVEKLYTGILKDFINPNNPITHINYGLIEKDRDKIHKIEKDYIIFKVGNIQLKNISNRDISLSLHDNYSLKDKDMKDIPVKLFFSNNEKNIILTKNTTSTDIFCYFKINNDSHAIGTYYLNDINKTSREFSVKIDFSDNSILKNNQLFTFSNYEITPLALFNYTTNIYTTSIGINKEDNVHFTRANFWFSRPEIINSPNIFSIDGAFSNSFLLSLGTGRKSATFETFDGTPIKPLSSTSSNILNNSYFQIKFSKESGSFKSSFYRRDENIKKVIVKIGWILSEDTIVINYFNEPPKFNLQVQKHMEFGYISKVLNKTYTADAEISILSENNSLIYTPSILSNTITIYEDTSGSNGDEILVQLSPPTVDPDNKKIRIRGTIDSSTIKNKNENSYNGVIPVTVTATENPTGGRF